MNLDKLSHSHSAALAAARKTFFFLLLAPIAASGSSGYDYEWDFVLLKTNNEMEVSISLMEDKKRISHFHIKTENGLSVISDEWYHDIKEPFLNSIRVQGGCVYSIDDVESLEETCVDVIVLELKDDLEQDLEYTHREVVFQIDDKGEVKSRVMRIRDADGVRVLNRKSNNNKDADRPILEMRTNGNENNRQQSDTRIL